MNQVEDTVTAVENATNLQTVNEDRTEHIDLLVYKEK